jgi:hypothetical protein
MRRVHLTWMEQQILHEAALWILLGLALLFVVCLVVVPRWAARLTQKETRWTVGLVLGAITGAVIGIGAHVTAYLLADPHHVPFGTHVGTGAIWGGLLGASVTLSALVAKRRRRGHGAK